MALAIRCCGLDSLIQQEMGNYDPNDCGERTGSLGNVNWSAGSYIPKRMKLLCTEKNVVKITMYTIFPMSSLFIVAPASLLHLDPDFCTS